MAIKHSFVSQIVDDGDTAFVQPTDWNDAHQIEDGTINSAALGGGTSRRRVRKPAWRKPDIEEPLPPMIYVPAPIMGLPNVAFRAAQRENNALLMILANL